VDTLGEVLVEAIVLGKILKKSFFPFQNLPPI
jgi:hypothetical protein